MFNDDREFEFSPTTRKRLKILAAILLLLLFWPSIYWPKKIQVLDYETNQPIADAIAIYKYAITSRGMDFLFGWIPIGHGGNSYYNCIKSVITKTDANGYFKIPFRITFFGQYAVSTYIYKQGYKDGEPWAYTYINKRWYKGDKPWPNNKKKLENTIYLSKDNRSSSERIQYIYHLFQGTMCRNIDNFNKKLAMLRLQEMKKIATTVDDFKEIKDLSDTY